MSANDLLLWLSTMGSGSWSRYRVAIDEMFNREPTADGEEDTGDTFRHSQFPLHHRLRVNIECLGHADFIHNESQNGWRVAPPTLSSTVTSNGAMGIVCGARSDCVMERVHDATSHLTVPVREQSFAPDCIQICAGNQDTLVSIAEKANLHFQADAPQILLASLPPVDDQRTLRRHELPFGDDWCVTRFLSTTLKWTESSAFEARASRHGLFRFDLGFARRYFLRIRGATYSVPVQLGKYILLSCRRRRRVVSFDADARELSMPVTCRPPLLTDRALTLCSGLVPAVKDGMLTYGGVSSEIASYTTALLRQ